MSNFNLSFIGTVVSANIGKQSYSLAFNLFEWIRAGHELNKADHAALLQVCNTTFPDMGVGQLNAALYNAETIAEACHNANNAHCIANGQTTYPSWTETPKENKDLQIKAVVNLLLNPDTTAEDLFNLWKESKIAAGWIYGPVKDAATKQHPCIVDYADLPEVEKLKDIIIIDTVKYFVSC